MRCAQAAGRIHTCIARTVLVQLKEKVAKLSSSAVSARTRTRELEDAWERINELCKERGAQARCLALPADGPRSCLPACLCQGQTA